MGPKKDFGGARYRVGRLGPLWTLAQHLAAFVALKKG